ncbi:MAG: SDR family oxidoreductase [Candidatus Andersenbacteria bacterium]
MARKKPKPPFPAQHQKKPGAKYKLLPRPRYKAREYVGSGKLEDKITLITGGDSEIGRAVATFFAREGSHIAITHMPPEKKGAEATQAAVKKERKKISLIEGDITDPGFCEYAIERVIDDYGRLDIVINSAVYQHHQDNIENLTLEQWGHTFKMNIDSYFYIIKYALPYLKEGSTIINTGSVAGIHGNAKLLDYSAAKGAIHAFTKSLAQHLLYKGIRVNCVALGPIRTSSYPTKRKAKDTTRLKELSLMGRPAEPEEIAPAFVFFASNTDSGYITGEILTLPGNRNSN